MAEGKAGGAAGLFAKQVQKKFSRAQEKVLQKLGKTVETKDERFEQSAGNFYQQQAEGHKLYKDLKSFLSAVKVMHESSKRVSETLQEIYSSEWDGHEDLKAIAEVTLRTRASSEGSEQPKRASIQRTSVSPSRPPPPKAPPSPKAVLGTGTPSPRASLEASSNPEPPEKPLRSPEVREKEDTPEQNPEELCTSPSVHTSQGHSDQLHVSVVPGQNDIITPEPQEEVSTNEDARF